MPRKLKGAMVTVETAVPGDRKRLLDVIRGFALCGILLINIPYMGNSAWLEFPPGTFSLADLDWQAFAISSLFIEGTMRGLFTLLFGASMILMLEKARPGGPTAADLHYRRAFALVLFGLVHAFVFLWFGDILFAYGLTAILLFPLRLARPSALFAVAATLLVAISVSGLSTLDQTAFQRGKAAFAAQEAGETLSGEQEAWRAAYVGAVDYRFPPTEKLEQERAARLGSFSEISAAHWPIWAQWNASTFFAVVIAETLAFMLIGVGLLRLGVLGGERSGAVYAWLAGIGYGGGVAVNALELWQGAQNNFAPGVFQLNDATYELGRLLVTLGHVGLLGLVWRGGVRDWLGRGFEILGRMALTNYLGASIVCAVLFYGIGFGLFGRFSTYQLWGIAAAILLSQGAFSALWLRAFRLGPFEWLLRSIAYWRLQPLRRGRKPEPPFPAAS